MADHGPTRGRDLTSEKRQERALSSLAAAGAKASSGKSVSLKKSYCTPRPLRVQPENEDDLYEAYEGSSVSKFRPHFVGGGL